MKANLIIEIVVEIVVFSYLGVHILNTILHAFSCYLIKDAIIFIFASIISDFFNIHWAVVSL